MNLKSVDLLPDPQLVNVVAKNRQKVVHLFRADSHYDPETSGFSNKNNLRSLLEERSSAFRNEY